MIGKPGVNPTVVAALVCAALFSAGLALKAAPGHVAAPAIDPIPIPSSRTNQDNFQAPTQDARSISKLAFATDRDGNMEIYVMDVDGAGQTRLTENTAEDYSPAWSPDGSRLAFVSTRDGNAEIYVMNVDGTGQSRLTTNSASDLGPAWSPDSSQIAFFTNRDGNDEIYSMNPDGSNQMNLTNNFADDTSPSFSTDGKLIAFSSTREDSQHDIYTMTPGGSAVTRLTTAIGDDTDPSWAAQRITFTSKAGKLDEAQTAINDALRLGTKDARLFYHAGMIARARNRSAAEQFLKRALDTNQYFDPMQSRIAAAALKDQRSAD